LVYGLGMCSAEHVERALSTVAGNGPSADIKNYVDK